MNLLNKHWKIGATLLFGVVVFLHWWLVSPMLLAYQEQYQLFLMDGDYLCQRLMIPDGFACCLGEYLTQFYINHALGAFVLAIIYVITQRLVWLLMKAVSPQASLHYPLSFLPVLTLWLLQGDENVLLTFPVAIILSLSTMYLYEKAGKYQIYFAIIALPLLYWLAGPVVLMFVAWIVLRQWQTATTKWKGLCIGIFFVIYILVCILVDSWILPYLLFRLFYGVDYYRFIEVYYWMFFIAMLLCVLTPLSVHWMPNSKKRIWLAGACEAGVLLVLFLLLRPSFYDARKYEVIEYDYLVRCQRWDEIISKADQKTPDLPMTVCATNLALGMKGQLGERLFDFYQNGMQGLLPSFERNFSTIMLTGEVYWQLGLINSAQRFAFEAMEALPNYAKSCRAVKRLAETNLVNGEYAVARKYLQMLGKTLSYSQWARRTMPLLGNEKAINEHPIYGRMRQLRLQEDFLFSEQELDKIFGQLMMRNQQNGLALQYLLAAPLLDRDVNKFMNYMVYVDGLHLGYRPRSCQEAIAFAYAQRNQRPPQGYVNEIVMRNFSDFRQIYSQGGQNAPQLGRFRNTAWYYLIGAK